MTGNKGEWSEIYVFLKLLAEGKLNAADANLNAIPHIFYPIIKIIRQENQNKREYHLINGNIKIIDGTNGNEILNLPKEDFVKRSQQLFDEIRKVQGRSFGFEDIECFLKSIQIKSLTASKTDKADIKVVVHDLYTGLKPQLGFSIKSMLGGNSTLFNPGNTTNFIYKVTGEGELNIDEINKIEKVPKIANRISTLSKKGFVLTFERIQSKKLELNLKIIDSDLPKILASLLLLKYSTPRLDLLEDAVEQLTKENPLKYDLSKGHPFYEYKIKNFLTDSALGMTPTTIWKGQYDATGGIIIVKDNGELVCYHIFNRNEFQNYLLKNTKLEQASTKRYKFGSLYREDGGIYIKLNLQVRFN